jgi:glutamine amidotransferase PdxT
MSDPMTAKSREAEVSPSTLAPGAANPAASGDAGLHKPDHHHSATAPLPSDYQADPGDPYRRIAVRQAGSAATRGSRKKASDDVDRPSRSADPLPGPEDRAPEPVPARDAASPTGEPAPGRVEAKAPVLDPTDGLASAAPVPIPPAPALHAAGSEHCRDHEPLRIAHLYPSLLNVAGDGGNLMALQRRAEWRGIPVEVVAVEKGETPDFRAFDIVLFHGGQDVEMAVAAADFARKAPSLREAVAEGVVVFAVCAGLQLLGHRYTSNAGEEMVGAGILDLETRGGPQRFMQHAACEVEINGATETVVGFENHSGLTELGSGCEAFGRVLARSPWVAWRASRRPGWPSVPSTTRSRSAPTRSPWPRRWRTAASAPRSNPRGSSEARRPAEATAGPTDRPRRRPADRRTRRRAPRSPFCPNDSVSSRICPA